MSQDNPGLLDDVIELPSRALALGRAAGGAAVVSGLALVPAALIVLVAGQAATWIALRPAHHGEELNKSTLLGVLWFMLATTAAALALVEAGPLAAFTLASGQVQVGVGRALNVGLARWGRLALLDFVFLCPAGLVATLNDVIDARTLGESYRIVTAIAIVVASAFVYVRWTTLAAPLIVGWNKPTVLEALREAHALGHRHRLLLVVAGVAPWLALLAARPSGLVAAQLPRNQQLMVEGVVLVLGIVVAFILRPLLAVAALEIARERARPQLAPESSA